MKLVTLHLIEDVQVSKRFGGSVEILGTSNDPTEIQKAVAAKLGGVDTILTLGAGLSEKLLLKH